MKHDSLACPGNICQTDPENYLRNWWSSEKVCTAKPYAKWQKVQIKINKLLAKGKFKNPDCYFYLDDLLKIRRVTQSTKGIPSERKFKINTQKQPAQAIKMPYKVLESNQIITRMSI